MEKNKTYWLKEVIKLIIMGIIIGIIIAIYKYAVTFVLRGSSFFYNSNYVVIRIVFLLISLLSMILSYYIIKFDGTIQGNGIAQVDIHVKKNVRQIKWYKSLPLMFINSLISFFNGLPFGSEAPSAFLGSMVGMGANDLINNEDDDIYIGMGGGFAAAFISPLAGVFYSIEECFEKFNIKRVAKLLITTIFATITSWIINKERIIEIDIDFALKLKDYLPLVIMILIDVGISLIISTVIPKIKKFVDVHHSRKFVKIRFFSFFIISIILINFIPVLAGSGLGLIKYLDTNPTWYLVVVFLFVRLILFFVSGSCLATGGTLLPVLAIGAMSGYLSCLVFSNIFSFEKENYALFIVISMCLLFALTNKTPFTAFILTLSFSGIKNLKYTFLPAVFVLVISLMLIKLLHIESLNDKRVKLLKTSRNYKSKYD